MQRPIVQPNTSAPGGTAGTLPGRPGGLVVAVGGANMDIAAHSLAPLRAADSNPGQIRSSAGGVARNVAENLCRLGAQVRLVSVLGDDAFGSALLAQAHQIGLQMQTCAVLPGQRTGTYISMHGPDGDMALAVNDMDILEQLTPAALQQHAQAFDAASALVMDCNLRADSLAWLLQTQGGLPCFVDAVSVAKCLRIRPHLPHIHTLKVNAFEAQALCGLPCTTVDEAQGAARHLCALGARRVVLTLGARGLVWCDGNASGAHQPAHTVPVASATGAGDALLAGLVYGHLQGWSLAQALEWGMACAEITLQSPYANATELSAALVAQRMAHR